MTVRMRVTNPGAPRKGTSAMAAKRRRRAGKRRAGKRKTSVVRRKRHSVARKSHRRAKRRSYVASRGKGGHARMRTYRVKRRGRRAFHVRGFRARLRRKNPGTAGLVAAAIGLGAGLAATLLASYAIDVFLGSQSSTVQTGVLVGAAALTGFLVSSPAIAAGVVTGLLVVPLSKAVYNMVPSLANPTPLGGSAGVTVLPGASSGAAAVSGGSVVANISALHRANAMGSLHMGKAGGNRRPGHVASYNRAHTDGKGGNLRLGALHTVGRNALNTGSPIRGAFVPGTATMTNRFR
jgi:hypothetical protein